jgi:hypothetical protein
MPGTLRLPFLGENPVSGANLRSVLLSSRLAGRLNWSFPWFWGAFAKLRKATISFVMSVCPSVRMEQLGFYWTGFHAVWHLSVLRKFVEEIKIWLNSDNNSGYFTWRPMCIFFTHIPCILIFPKFFYSPTDAQMNCLKNNFKVYIKIGIKTTPTCFGAVTPSSPMRIYGDILLNSSLKEKCCRETS